MTSFSALGLAAPLLSALVAEGYETPTPIQAAAIPYAMEGRDVLGLAQTGTGKTAAFALPLLHRLLADRKTVHPRTCRVLVLAPTRELAAQIGEGFRAYGENARVTVQVVFGGIPIPRQVRALERGADIVVATPGRLLDLINQRALRLDSVEALVLDEADHMLDLGFIEPLRKIRSYLPKKRHTLLFSATMPAPIAKLAQEFLNDPVEVAVTPPATTAERIAQCVYRIAQNDKQKLLQQLLVEKKVGRALVFTRTKHGADRVVRGLEVAGFEAFAIHGNKSQNQRERALNAFRDGRATLLVATDIAARGIDVDGVTHVFQFDMPDTPEAYVHRIGRTARAGASGEAVAFCAPEEASMLRDVEKLTRLKVPVAADMLPPGMPKEATPLPRGGRQQPRRPMNGESRSGGDFARKPVSHKPSGGSPAAAKQGRSAPAAKSDGGSARRGDGGSGRDGGSARDGAGRPQRSGGAPAGRSDRRRSY